jgi:diguanylate cyclase (GGDEF)-like protein
METDRRQPLDDPSVGQIVLTTRDVRERKTLERQLTQVALHDLLTNLPNRTLFRDRVGQALASAAGARRHTTVLLAGPGRLQARERELGHPVGDQVLQEVSRRLEASIRAQPTPAAGWAGTSLESCSTATPRPRMGWQRRIASSPPARTQSDLADEPIHLVASVGVSTVAPAQRALDREEFVLDYQPIVELATGELVAAEALIRWEHPTHGRIGPSVFIPLAEESGLIDEIGTWVLQAACTQAARWAKLSPGRVPRASINLSAHQLADPQLAWTLQAALAHAGATPSWVTIEITESSLMQDRSASRERLHAIRALGVQIAIDDFGTGFSSLATLEQFPVTQLKIDRSFVTPLGEPRRGSGVVHAIIEIGHALGLTTVGEGIDTPIQFKRLRKLGCELGQGSFFSQPLEPDAMADLVSYQVGPAFARQVAAGHREAAARTKRSASARAAWRVRRTAGVRP